MLSTQHQIALEARGLDVELLESLGVQSSQRGSNWIQIPFYRKGEIVNWKYRTIIGEKEFRQDKDAVKCFWNEQVISDTTLAEHALLICEGEMDALSAIQCGFIRSVSVPDGAPSKSVSVDDGGTKYSYVVDALAALKDVREIILCTDNDGPGIVLMNDLAVILGKPRCKYLRYPKGCKDLNDVLKTFGAKAVVETIGRAKFMKVDGVYRMSELPPVPEAIPYDIGIVGLSSHFKMRLGDFSVILGIPGHGKSSVANEIMCRMAENHGWVTGIASFEQKAQIDLRRNLRTFRNRKYVTYQTQQEIDDADRWIDDYFALIIPAEDDEVTLGWVLERAAAAIIHRNAKLIIIDPWNELDHDRGDMSETDYTGYAIKQFRKLARKYNVHVSVVIHPTKLHPPKPGEKIPCPTLYDASGSSHWFGKCDAGIIVHKLDDTRTLIRVAKIKYHGITGLPGDLIGHFLKDQQRFDIEVKTEKMI